jgi:hypothetical protein
LISRYFILIECYFSINRIVRSLICLKIMFSPIQIIYYKYIISHIYWDTLLPLFVKGNLFLCGVFHLSIENVLISNIFYLLHLQFNFICQETSMKQIYLVVFSYCWIHFICNGGRRGRDRMVVGFITTYAISAYHHWCCEFESRSVWDVQHYVIKVVSDLWQVGGFLRVLQFPTPLKLTATI